MHSVTTTVIRTQNSSVTPQNSPMLPLCSRILSPPVTSGNHQSVLHCRSFAFSRMLYTKWNHIVGRLLSVASLTSLAFYLWDPSMLLHISVAIPFYHSVVFYRIDVPLFMPMLKEIWVLSTFWQLYLVLIQTFVYRFLCKHTFSFLHIKHPGEGCWIIW